MANKSKTTPDFFYLPPKEEETMKVLWNTKDALSASEIADKIPGRTWPASEDQNLYKIFAKADLHNNIPGIKIIVHAYVNSPAITGFFHPVIILPDIKFNNNELLVIFIHEISHYRFKHHFIKLIMELICAVFWWNPLFKKLSSELSYIMELQSDKAVCLNLDHNQKKEYLQAMAKVALNIKNRNVIPPCLCSILEENSGENLLQRFKMIAENSYQTRKKLDIIVIPHLEGIKIYENKEEAKKERKVQ